MNDQVIICSSCGAKCAADDLFCKVCFQTLTQSENSDVQAIDGITNEDLDKFLEKNGEYYIDRFSRTERKHFLQLNFAALFFGPTWFFYRKMHRVAMAYAAIFILLSSLLTVVLPVVFQADVEHYYEAKAAYLDYKHSGKDILYQEDGPGSPTKLHPEYQKVADDLKYAQNKIRWLQFFMIAPVVTLNILFRLCGNAIYKNHIELHIGASKGGVSLKSGFWGWAGVNAVIFVVSALIGQIPAVSRFVEATMTLFRWM